MSPLSIAALVAYLDRGGLPVDAHAPEIIVHRHIPAAERHLHPQRDRESSVRRRVLRVCGNGLTERCGGALDVKVVQLPDAALAQLLRLLIGVEVFRRAEYQQAREDDGCPERRDTGHLSILR